MGELVYITGEIRGRIPPPVQRPVQRWLDDAHLVRCHGTALEAPLGQQRCRMACFFEACSGLVDMQDPTILAVEVDACIFGHAARRFSVPSR